jgi:hypothetical protein
MNADKRRFESNLWLLIAAAFLIPAFAKAQAARQSGVTAPGVAGIAAKATPIVLTPTPTALPQPTVTPTPVVATIAGTATMVPTPNASATPTFTQSRTSTPTATATRTVTSTPTSTPGVFQFKVSPHPVQGAIHFQWGATMQSQEVTLIVYTGSFRPVSRFVFNAGNRVDYLTAGSHEFVWNGLDGESRSLVPGTYLCFIGVRVRKINYEASGEFATP